MLIITDKKGRYVPGMGGDPRLFTKDKALLFIRDRLAQDPEWGEGSAIVEPYTPNPIQLDAIEYLEDKGFRIVLDSDGDYIIVDCDSLWSAPMVDLLNDVLLNGVHYLNRDHDFKVVFGEPEVINCAFQDHSLKYPIFFDFNGHKHVPSLWRRRIEQ